MRRRGGREDGDHGGRGPEASRPHRPKQVEETEMVPRGKDRSYLVNEQDGDDFQSRF